MLGCSQYLENTYTSSIKTKPLIAPADQGLAIAIIHLAEDQYWPSQYHRMWTEKVCLRQATPRW